ncbi:phosphoribosyl-dephospho-CoA transferase MdcG domain-containing protein [Yersinia pseudotuberculosis]|uniref:phosphoribosyl-dephospho-CoA transferase MdcG domain-containing protein n=1 Tax=Yersinia pseudotuberculosis TaxID=633 RepID=UPI0005DE6747|nr:phosphoribosyl-dephospho-CoA transferase MdcG domain-containing protein [Yersinia pseudotuberculosis]CNC80610.1 phosphoribosyl-dephospho-CoA transferase [Yersinia pseudotuberculosis]
MAQRHDLFTLTPAAIDRVVQCFYLQYKDTDPHLVDICIEGLLNGVIPAIYRRGCHQEHQSGYPVGFSFPLRDQGRRFKLATTLTADEIKHTVTPYQVAVGAIHYPDSKAMKTFSSIRKGWCFPNAQLGLWGSCAMEMFSGMQYVDDDSDLDLIIQNAPLTCWHELYQLILAHEKSAKIIIDAEMCLDNGYGISLKEYMGDGKTLLGKSLFDVKLLSRNSLS